MSLTIQSGGSITLQGGAGGGGAISAVHSAQTALANSTASATYVALTNPVSITATTGTSVLVTISAYGYSSSAGKSAFLSLAVSGATTIAASDATSVIWTSATSNFGGFMGRTYRISNLTAGSNTFALKMRSDGGTATVATVDLTVQTLA